MKTGCRVILACRSEERGHSAIDDLVQEPDIKSHDLVCMQLDLSSLKSVRDFAEKFNAQESRLDLLVNNASCLPQQDKTTEDGFELSFGVNHLGNL